MNTTNPRQAALPCFAIKLTPEATFIVKLVCGDSQLQLDAFHEACLSTSNKIGTTSKLFLRPFEAIATRVSILILERKASTPPQTQHNQELSPKPV